jgi:MFS family permease
MNRLATLAGYCGFVLLGWNAVLVPALIRSIQPDLRQADAAFGLFFLVSALLYAAGSFSGGLLLERVGRRAVLALATLLLGVGLGCEALAPSWLGFLRSPLTKVLARPVAVAFALLRCGLAHAAPGSPGWACLLVRHSSGKRLRIASAHLA